MAAGLDSFSGCKSFLHWAQRITELRGRKIRRDNPQYCP